VKVRADAGFWGIGGVKMGRKTKDGRKNRRKMLDRTKEILYGGVIRGALNFHAAFSKKAGATKR